MEPAQDGVNLFVGEGQLDFLHDVVGSAVAATVHDEQALKCVEDKALFVIETVGNVFAVQLDGKAVAGGDCGAAFCAEYCVVVTYQKNARQDFRGTTRGFARRSAHKLDAFAVALEPSAVYADIFLIGKQLEEFMPAVAVFAGTFPQVKTGVVICLEKIFHATGVVIMGVA